MMDIQAQAQTLVRDMLAYVLDGRIDEEARITYAGWIIETIEAAVEAKATELSEVAGGLADVNTLHARVEELLDTLRQLFGWVAEALPVVSAAYAAAEQSDQLTALAQAVAQYKAHRTTATPADPLADRDQHRASNAVDQTADVAEVMA